MCPHRHGLLTLSVLALTWVATVPAWAEPADGVEYLGEAIEVRDVAIDADHRLEDVRGVNLDFRYRVGRVDTSKALFLVAHVTAGGQKVRALVKNGAFHARDGSLHGKKQLLTVPRNVWKKGSIFLPFYAMKLAEGAHRLELRFEGVSDVGSCKTGELPRRLKIVGQKSVAVAIVKPPHKMVQLLVRRIQVAEATTDAYFIRRYKGRPDLQWRARFRAGSGGVMHSSETHDDTYAATWKRYSSPFPFSQGDRLTIAVLDQDVMSHDRLGSISLSLEDLQKRGGGGAVPLPQGTRGSIKSLVFGAIKLR